MKLFMEGRPFFSASVLMITIVFIAGCQAQPQDPSQTLKPIVVKYIGVWNTGNLQALDAIVDTKFVRVANLAPDVDGADGLKKVISGFRAEFPDMKITLDDLIYSDNRCSFRWTFTGTNTGSGELPPTGRSVKIWGLATIYFSNGKMTGEWVAYDNQAFMDQLGTQ